MRTFYLPSTLKSLKSSCYILSDLKANIKKEPKDHSKSRRRKQLFLDSDIFFVCDYTTAANFDLSEICLWRRQRTLFCIFSVAERKKFTFLGLKLAITSRSKLIGGGGCEHFFNFWRWSISIYFKFIFQHFFGYLSCGSSSMQYTNFGIRFCGFDCWFMFL